MEIFEAKHNPSFSIQNREVKNKETGLPVELSSCLSLFPLHSATTSARLVSSLSIESKSWGLVPQGPIGETGSKTGTQWDEKGNTLISHIFVSFDNAGIKSIQFGYFEKGALVMSAKYGGPSKGQNFRVVKLKHNEYVTGLSGVIRWSQLLREGFRGISELTFYTNLGKHGPICEPVTAPSVLKYPHVTSVKKEIDLTTCDRGEFGGFFGSSDAARLKSIGIYVSPILSSDKAVKREYV